MYILLSGNNFIYRRDVYEYIHCQDVTNVGHPVSELGSKLIPIIWKEILLIVCKTLMQKLAHFWNLGPDSKFFLKANIKALIYSGLRSPLIGHYCLFHLYRQSSVKKPTSENTSSNNTFYISTLFTYLPKITLHPHQPWLTLNRAKVIQSYTVKGTTTIYVCFMIIIWHFWKL